MRNDTFKFKITPDRHNAIQNLNYYDLTDPRHFSLPSTFNLEKYTFWFLRYKIIRAPKKLIKWPHPLFRPKTIHTCHKKPSLAYRMRSSLVVRASDCQCTSCNGPGFEPSIRRHSGIWGAADEAVLNIVRTKRKKSPQKIFKKKKCHEKLNIVHSGCNLWLAFNFLISYVEGWTLGTQM